MAWLLKNEPLVAKGCLVYVQKITNTFLSQAGK